MALYMRDYLLRIYLQSVLKITATRKVLSHRSFEHIPGTPPISPLVFNHFAVKYVWQEHADHPIKIFKENYNPEKYPEGYKYIGISFVRDNVKEENSICQYQGRLKRPNDNSSIYGPHKSRINHMPTSHTSMAQRCNMH